MTQYNGMLVGADGRLLLKGWALTRHDLGFFPQRVGVAGIADLLTVLLLMLLLRKLFRLRWRRTGVLGVAVFLTLPFAAARGQLYVVDHSRNLSPAQMLGTVGRRPAEADMEKFFVVLDVTSGAERLRVPLGAGSPVASMLIPGMNDDVFVATREALHRIHQMTADELTSSKMAAP